MSDVFSTGYLIGFTITISYSSLVISSLIAIGFNKDFSSSSITPLDCATNTNEEKCAKRLLFSFEDDV